MIEDAFNEGMGKFLMIIRFTDACKTLKTEEEDIVSEFMLWIIERKEEPLKKFRGDRGASFKTYLAVIFKYWLFRVLKAKKLDTTNNSEIFEQIKDPRNTVEEQFERNEEEAKVLDALDKCLEGLPKLPKKLIQLIIYGSKRIKEVASELKRRPSKVYNEYYKALKDLKKCLNKKGIKNWRNDL